MNQNKLKNCSVANTTLYREVNGKVRYYCFKVYPTLFGEYLLEKSYGSIKNKKPTRTIKKYFLHLEELLIAVDLAIHRKIKKGYT